MNGRTALAAARTRTSKVQDVAEQDMAEQQQGVIPHLVVANAVEALAFYAKAFGATETMRLPSDRDGRLMHAEITVNGSKIFVRDDFPDYRAEHCDDRVLPPHLLGGTSLTLHLEVPDCDEAVRRAKAAGATVVMPPIDAFWGARYAQIADPYGHVWSFAHPLPGRRN
jgi:PhnB protein